MGQCGPRRITRIIYQYDPLCVDDLAWLLRQDERLEAMQIYEQSLLWSVCRMVGGKSFDMIQPRDFAKRLAEHTKRDNRSAEEIVEELRRKLMNQG